MATEQLFRFTITGTIPLSKDVTILEAVDSIKKLTEYAKKVGLRVEVETALTRPRVTAKLT